MWIKSIKSSCLKLKVLSGNIECPAKEKLLNNAGEYLVF